MVICLERGADLRMAQVMPLPLTVSCSSKIQIGFTFLVPAHPGCPGKETVKWLLLLLLLLFVVIGDYGSCWAACNWTTLPPRPTVTTHRVSWRHRIYGHDTIAILWV